MGDDVVYVPLKQRVTITPFIELDPDWNTPKYGDPYEMRCRFSEGVKLVRNRHGQEVASVGSFIFDRLPRITIDDIFMYTDDNDREVTYTPIAISVKRALNGKPIITEVAV